MPKFTITAAFYMGWEQADVVLEAETLEAACQQVIDWVDVGDVASNSKTWDPGPTFIAAASEGEHDSGWMGEELTIPTKFTEAEALKAVTPEVRADGPDFRALLAAILPYAESRAEDLDEAKEAGNEDPTFPGAADACAAVDAAKAALGGEVMPWTIIAPYNALRELLNCAELNQDDLEPETRVLIRRLQTIADPLAIPSAADLRKSRLADAGEDMLAALERALFVLTSSTMPAFVNDGGTVDVVRAAIAKAKGESSDSEAIARAAGWSFDATEGAMMQAGTGSYFTCKTPDWDKAVNWSGRS